MVFFRLCSFQKSRSPNLPPSSTLQASSSLSGAIWKRNVNIGISHISGSASTMSMRSLHLSLYYCWAAENPQEERIKHVGSTDVRYGHRFLPSPSTFLPTLNPPTTTTSAPVTHVSFKITLKSATKNINSPLRCHEDLGMVVAHGGAVLPSKVVDVVALLVGEAGRRLKLDN